MAKSNDAVVRLRGDSSDLNKTLETTAKKLQQFGKGGLNSLMEMAGGFGKLIPAVAAAAGGMKAFNAVVSSSQELGDRWATVQAQCTAVTNEFVYAIANFDFTKFDQGLDRMIEKAKDAYAAMDQLGNATMSYGVISAKENSNINAQMTVMKNQTKTIEERNAAMESAKKSVESLRDAAKMVQSDLLTAINTEVANISQLEMGQFDFEDVLSVAIRDAKFDRAELKKKAEEQYKEYQKAEKEVQKQYGEGYKAIPGSLDLVWDPGKPMVLKQKMAELNEQYKDAIINNALLNMYGDDMLQKLDNQISSYYTINDQIAANEQKLNKVGVAIDNAEKKVAKAKVAEKPLEGSLAYYQELLTQANKDLINAATSEARTAAQKVVDEVSYQIALIKNEDVGKGGRLGMQTNATIGTTSGLSIRGDMPTFNKAVVQSDNRIEKAKQAMESFKQFDLSQQIESVNSLASAFQSLGNTVGGAAGQVIALIGSMAQQVTQGMTTIATLRAQEAAYKDKMNAAFGASVAETMEAHSAIPFVGVALGVGMAATIIATLASLPKFAEGGVVSQPTLGLFGEAGPEAIVPLDRLEAMIQGNGSTAKEQKVIFEIHDKKLSGIMSNYNQRNSRHI